MNRRLRLGISSCLLGNKVRYDGEDKREQFLTDTLGKYAEFVPVCPETECGMGIPRETLHLIGDTENPRLMTTQTQKDYTEQMAQWADKKITELNAENLCGFIFKKNSPSCGIEQVKVFNKKGEFVKKGVGMFARIFMEHFPFLSVIDEEQFHDPRLRKHFMAAWSNNRINTI